MEFALLKQTDDEIWFGLQDTAETREKYPFAFELQIGYRLCGREVEVLWKVKNPSDDTMYFSIGGHPAFAAAPREKDRTTCYISFAGCESVQARKLAGGLASDEVCEVKLSGEGIIPVTEELFADDALIIEGNQTGKVSLLDEEKNPYLTVTFDAPLFGIWSPPGKNAPFICIEPWYGRCDRADFAGTLEEREWGNVLAAKEEFAVSYRIGV